jgi:hypothetical protein
LPLLLCSLSDLPKPTTLKSQTMHSHYTSSNLSQTLIINKSHLLHPHYWQSNQPHQPPNQPHQSHSLVGLLLLRTWCFLLPFLPCSGLLPLSPPLTIYVVPTNTTTTLPPLNPYKTNLLTSNLAQSHQHLQSPMHITSHQSLCPPLFLPNTLPHPTLPGQPSYTFLIT